MRVPLVVAQSAAARIGGLGTLMILISMLVSSCRCAPSRHEPGAPPAAPAPSTSASVSGVRTGGAATADAGQEAPDAAPRLPPLAASGALVSLEVPDFADAVVSVPLGATEKRPVVVALHGNFDRPEWQCEVWREITEAHPFVLCPRGIARGDAPKSWDRWTYGAMKRVEQELLAGLEALQRAFPEHIDDGPVVFTGFSLGAILGRYILKNHADRFPRAVLTEGGNEGWNWLARAYHKSGGERVLFGCAQSACVQLSRAASRHAERAGLEARVADGGNVGHTYDGPVAAAVKSNWPWVVAGDARYPGAEPLPEPDAGADSDAGRPAADAALAD